MDEIETIEVFTAIGRFELRGDDLHAIVENDTVVPYLRITDGEDLVAIYHLAAVVGVVMEGYLMEFERLQPGGSQ